MDKLEKKISNDEAVAPKIKLAQIYLTWCKIYIGSLNAKAKPGTKSTSFLSVDVDAYSLPLLWLLDLFLYW